MQTRTARSASGEVDAIVAPGPDGDRVYTLKGADEAYRLMIQTMAEGALTIAPDGLILFSNERLASILAIPARAHASAPVSMISLFRRMPTYFPRSSPANCVDWRKERSAAAGIRRVRWFRYPCPSIA